MITTQQIDEAKKAMEDACDRFHTLLHNYNIQERGGPRPMDVNIINYIMKGSNE